MLLNLSMNNFHISTCFLRFSLAKIKGNFVEMLEMAQSFGICYPKLTTKQCWLPVY